MSTFMTWAGCAVVGALSGLAGGYFGVGLRQQDARGSFSEIRTHSLVLLDDAGKSCGGLAGGNSGSAQHASLYLGGPMGEGPKLVLSVDSMEGEPKAMMYLRSSGIDTEDLGILILQSTQGWPSVSLAGPGSAGNRQLVELGSTQMGQQSVLRLERGPEPIAAWPK